MFELNSVKKLSCKEKRQSRDLSLGLLGEKREHYLCAMAPLPSNLPIRPLACRGSVAQSVGCPLKVSVRCKSAMSLNPLVRNSHRQQRKNAIGDNCRVKSKV